VETKVDNIGWGMVKKIVVTTDSWILTQETQMVTRYELKKYGNQKVTKKKGHDLKSEISKRILWNSKYKRT
jgi:hypothetical protein